MSDPVLDRMLALHAQGGLFEDIGAGLAAVLLRRGDLVVEAGIDPGGEAGVRRGCAVWTMGLLVGPEGRVLAFEPRPASAAMLRAAAAARGLGQVEVVEAAPAERGGTAQARDGSGRDLALRTLRLDDMVPVSAQPWRFARLDLAGGAQAALRGALAGLARWRPVLLLAPPRPGGATRPDDGEDVAGLLARLDYRLLDLLGRRLGRMPRGAGPAPDHLVAVPEGSAEAALVERHLTETVARLTG